MSKFKVGDEFMILPKGEEGSLVPRDLIGISLVVSYLPFEHVIAFIDEDGLDWYVGAEYVIPVTKLAKALK